MELELHRLPARERGRGRAPAQRLGGDPGRGNQGPGRGVGSGEGLKHADRAAAGVAQPLSAHFQAGEPNPTLVCSGMWNMTQSIRSTQTA